MLRRLISLALVLAVLPAGFASADPPPDPTPVVDEVVETVWDAYWAGCDVDLCIPPNGWDTDMLDPTLCPIFLSLAPGVPPAVTIGQDGDVYVGGSQVWNCPPYDEDPPFDPEQATWAIYDWLLEWANMFCSVDLCIPPGNPFLSCPIYSSLSPGVPGVVDIAPDGDIVVGGRKVNDCPPYDI